jgi:hypothetical protein
VKVYVFGNADSPLDDRAFEAEKKLQKDCPEIDFVEVKPNEDLPFSDNRPVMILDTVQGISEINVLTDKDLDRLAANSRTSAHDYDLGFQLKYLKKIGKVGKVTVVGIPQEGDIDYLRIQSIFKKLVAQDMQGS